MENIFMREALKLAQLAGLSGDVPVGAVVVRGRSIVGRGRNMREIHHSPSAHAEILAIEDAAHNLKNWRLNGCRLYVTLEPCAMCAGAIASSRIDAVYFGAFDKISGAICSVTEQYRHSYGNKVPEIFAGIMEYECSKLLTDFFSQRRLN